MPAIVSNGIIYAGGGSGGDGNANMRIVSWAEYLALPDSKYSDGVQYYISDGGGGVPGYSAPELEDIYLQLREIREMLITGSIVTTLLDSDNFVLLDNDGKALVNVGKIHIL